MPEIILPDDVHDEHDDDGAEQVNYNPTEYDEQEFFLMYHLKLNPSEIAAMDEEKRKWVIGRFMIQKQMEQKAMEEHRRMAGIMQGIDPSKLRVD